MEVKKIFIKNGGVVLLYLSSLLLFTLFINKIGMTYFFGRIYYVSLIMLFLASVYINRNSFMNVESIYLRYFVTGVFCVVLTLVLGYIALIATVNLHLSKGGIL